MDRPLIVGIGASAGGMGVLSRFLGALPPDGGMAFVVAACLDPDRLSRRTGWAVHVARNDEMLAPGAVHVMPEDSFLLIRDGRLQLRAVPSGVRGHRPIDVFFSALAQDQRENAVGILLPGAEADGTLGFAAIRAEGGVTMAPAADGPSPPGAAAGIADFTLGAAKMAEKLMEIRNGRRRTRRGMERRSAAVDDRAQRDAFNARLASATGDLDACRREIQALKEALHRSRAELDGRTAELGQANGDLRNLLDATQVAAVFVDADLMIRSVTPAAAEAFGLAANGPGRALRGLAGACDYPELGDHVREVFETGSIHEHRLARSGDTGHYLARITPYRSETESITGAVVTLIDVTTLARAEEHRKELVAELNHRVRNMLAVIIIIVRNSVSGKPVAPEGLDTLIDRLHGMARAYGLLSARSWTTVNIRDLMQEEVAPFDGRRVRLSGPNVDLLPSQVLAMSMVFHELAANAVKHGSLGSTDGTLDVRWKSASDRLALDWMERNGPRTHEPQRRGFGYILIEGQITRQLNGTLNTAFEPEGLSLKIDIPLSSVSPQS